MPAYKNRPPLDPDTPVWRHLSLNGVVATLRDKKLRLTRVDTFDDPFEGSVPQAQIDGQSVMFASNAEMQMMAEFVAANIPGMTVPPREDEEPYAKMTRRRLAMKRSVHASCWFAGSESETIWRLYCKDSAIRGTRATLLGAIKRLFCTDCGVPGLGVALRTSLKKLEASVVGHDLYVSPVDYILYRTAVGFTDEVDPFFHKRLGFQAEREVRLLTWNNAQYMALIQRPPSASELPVHLCLDWDVGAAIEEIVIGPYADEAYETHARAAISAADPTLTIPVNLSNLNPRSDKPGF